jgi:deoxyribodipyrimidine photolyase-like uncharacterized protein
MLFRKVPEKCIRFQCMQETKFLTNQPKVKFWIERGREFLLESFWADLERRPVRLTNDQQRLCQLAFQSLTPREML